MECTDSENVNLVLDDYIAKFIEKYKINPDKFLTEEDARCYLYSQLLDKFGDLAATEDNSESIPLHCEVRVWIKKGLEFEIRHSNP